MGLETFSSFCNRMYYDALKDRNAFGEEHISYNEYLKFNLDFLYEKYERKNTEQRRETVDGLNKHFGVHSL